ncbi:MAG: hypothetical protein M1286_01270 [Candidatus Marsarchaeota archaeon]|nr:hypothetical protein [Candidatus Marsarchaeota archaeon]
MSSDTQVNDGQEAASGMQAGASKAKRASPYSGHRSMWITVAIVALIIVIAGATSLLYNSAPQPNATSASTSVPTTVPPQNSFSPFLVSLADQQNALFSVPSSPQMHLYLNNTSPDSVLSQYGLNFTASLLASQTLAPASYVLSVPSEYANMTSPMIVSLSAQSYSGAAAARSGYLSVLTELHNSTAMNASGTTLLSAKNLSDFGNASVFSSALIYGLDEYSIYFVYGNYTVYASTFGNANSLSAGYIYNISSRIYGQMLNST